MFHTVRDVVRLQLLQRQHVDTCSAAAHDREKVVMGTSCMHMRGAAKQIQAKMFAMFSAGTSTPSRTLRKLFLFFEGRQHLVSSGLFHV